jgi:hypothetical protein
MAKVFVICPVRNAPEPFKRFMKIYVEDLEEKGHQVHWPFRDTDQLDPHGLQICLTNCDAIIEADEVHIWFDPESKGSHFDRGMLFAMLRLGMEKKVILINTVYSTEHKSFENVFRALAAGKDISRNV